jgi:hypothetical protein
MLWLQIEVATHWALPPWSPLTILKELHNTNYTNFWRLTEQVIGQWIDHERGTLKWTETVAQKVALGTGNAPGGHTTWCGLLVCPFIVTLQWQY